MIRMIGWLVVVSVVAVASPAGRDDDWVGQRVFTKDSAQPRVGEKSVDRLMIPYPATVTKVEGDWLWVGRAWVRKTDVMTIEQALAFWTEEIRRNPTASHAYGNRASAWDEKGELDNAIADATEAIRLDPTASTRWNNRAIYWQRKGEIENAIKDYTEAIRLKPSYATAYANRGNAHHEAGDFPSAIKDCTEAIRLDPGHARAYRSRADARRKSGDYEKAARDFESALRLDPTNPLVMKSLAWLRATCPDASFRDPARALELARKAGEFRNWADHGYLDTLAAAHAAAGDFAAAIEAQEKAIALQARQPSTARERKEYAARLALYKAGTPYRDEPGLEKE